MITDKQKEFLQLVLEGKIKKGRDPKKYSATFIRIRKHIDHMKENLLWLAINFPDILRDIDYELNDMTIKRYRRARSLLKAISLFEREDTVLSLIAEIYSAHQLEISKKKKQ